MADDNTQPAGGSYVPFLATTLAEAGQVGVILPRAIFYITSNADYWYKQSKATPGVICESLVKLCDQLIDWRKLEKENNPLGREIIETVAQALAGLQAEISAEEAQR